MDSYRTIANIAEAEIEVKKSRFIAALCPVRTEQEALAFLNSVRSAHPTARHHVYAYRMRENNRIRYSDDGEPQKTSGLPTLDALEGADLIDIICVTTRYFGGTLLGTGGLVRAYTGAAQAALEKATIVRFAQCRDLTLCISYPQYESVRHWIEEREFEIADTDFSDVVFLTVRALANEADGLAADLTDFCQGRIELIMGEEAFQQISEPLR